MRIRFEWDGEKEVKNRRKHGVSFELAGSVFADPHAISIYDEEHSQEEDRWVTVGIAQTGALLVIVHTYNAIDEETILLRIISGRRAVRSEEEAYNDK